MRAVLDTNVVVSGALSRGSPPGLVLRAARLREFELVTSEALLEEWRDVLARAKIHARIGWSMEETAEFVNGLLVGAEIVSPTQSVAVITKDESDNRVLEAAVEGDADYIVSGDNHLLELKEHAGIRVVTPATFVAILQASD